MTTLSLREAMDKAASLVLAMSDESNGSFADDFAVHQTLRNEAKRMGDAETAERFGAAAQGASKADQAAFWESRDELRAIRDTAWSAEWMGNPWAFLGTTLARAVAATPHRIMLPQIGGPLASLNLFVALVGLPGSGKGKAASAAGAILPGPEVHQVGLGSGEGINHQFAQRSKEGGLDWIRRSVLFKINETSMLKALQERNGSTLDAALRSAWVGEELGNAYVDPAKRLPLPDHSYRLCFVAAVHPELGTALMKGRNQGTPQRFLYFPTTEPDAPQDRPPCPGPLLWNPPEPGLLPLDGPAPPRAISVPESIRAEIREDHEARSRGKWAGSDLDAHAMLSRLKVAAALGILRAAQRPGGGRGHDRLLDEAMQMDSEPQEGYEITEEDWRLSRVVMGVSSLTRNALAAEEGKAESAANEKRGQMEGERLVIATRTADGHQSAAAAATLLRKLTRADGWVTAAELRKALRSDYRKFYEDGIEQLLTDQAIVSRHTQRSGGGHGGAGDEYRCA